MKAAGWLLGARFVQGRNESVGLGFKKRNLISLALLLGYWVLSWKLVSPVGQSFVVYAWFK